MNKTLGLFLLILPIYSTQIFSLDGYINAEYSGSTYRKSANTDGNYFSSAHTLYLNHSASGSFMNSSVNMNGYAKILSGENGNYQKNKASSESRITELYLSAGTESFFFDAGKQHIKTGTGLFKSPAYFFDSPSGSQMKRDTNNEKKTKEGTVGARAQWINNSISLTGYYSPRIHFSDNHENISNRISSEQEYHRALGIISTRISDLDLSLLYLRTAGSSEEKNKFGMTANISAGDSFTFYIDSAVSDEKTVWKTGSEKFMLKKSRTKYAICAVLGSSYSINEKNTLYAEYYYNGSGLKKDDYDSALDSMKEMESYQNGSAGLLYGKFGIFNLSRHYVMLRGSFSISGPVALTIMNVTNMADKSGLFEFTAAYDGSDYIVLASARNYYGKPRSEIGFYREVREITISGEYYF